MYNTLDRNQYTEQLRNLSLFLRGYKLPPNCYRVYVYLFKSAARRGDGLTFKTTLPILSMSTGYTVDEINAFLAEIRSKELFEKLEIQDGNKVFIKVKDLQGYARQTK